MIYVRNPPLLLVTAPGASPNEIRGLNLRGHAHDIIFGDESPVWLIYDREEFGYLRSNPQLLRVGFAVDPWSWYVWTWMTARKLGGEYLDSIRAWGMGSVVFQDVLYGMTHPERLSAAATAGLSPFAALAAPHPLGGTWYPADRGAWEGLLSSTLGLASFTFLYHYGIKQAWQHPEYRPDFGIDIMADGRQATAVLQHLGVKSEACSEVLASPAHHTSTPMPTIYDSVMAKWVSAADRPLIEVMGYTEPGAAARNSIAILRPKGATRRGPGPRISSGENFAVSKSLWRARTGYRP